LQELKWHSYYKRNKFVGYVPEMEIEMGGKESSEKKVKKSKKKLSLRTVMVLVIMAIVVMAIIITAGIAILGIKDNTKAVEEKIKSEGELTSKVIEGKLTEVTLKALEDKMESIRDTVRNYFKDVELGIRMISGNIYAQQFLDKPTVEGSEEVTEKIIATEKLRQGLEVVRKESVNAILAIYTGYESGEVVGVTDWEKEVGSSDPRTASWYKEAMASKGEIVWATPYIDKHTGKMAISVSKTIEDNQGQSIGVVGMDISLEALQILLNGYKLGEGGYVYAVAMDGLAFFHPVDMGETDPEKFKLVGKEVPVPEITAYAKKANAQTERVPYVYKGDNKIAIAVRVPELELSIYGAYKMEELANISEETKRAFEKLEGEVTETSKANEKKINIRIFISGMILLVFLSISVVMMVSAVVRPIKKITVYIKELTQGRFNREIENTAISKEISDSEIALETQRKEFSQMISGILNMANEINEAAVQLTGNGVDLKNVSEAVTITVEEIAHGATSQAMDAEESAGVMKTLSDEIISLTDYTDKQVIETDSLKETSVKGVQSIENLNDKTNASSEITAAAAEKTHELSGVIASITGITGTISSIAEQTNLLALNASIEAARAGESGRGFAVVADEIKKLAEETAQATGKITQMISQVKATSDSVVASMSSVEAITKEQKIAANDVNTAFGDIQDSLEKIVAMIEESTNKLVSIDQKKEVVVDKIQNIVAVTEETAAASEEVSASMEEENETIGMISALAGSLEDKIEVLNERLKRFQI